MRRSLIITITATTVMVLLAMLVPMAVLVNQNALQDRLARAALEVQATETVVSGQDKGAVSVYLESVNVAGRSIVTTVLYPDGTAIGPVPGEDARVIQARRSGQARVDDVAGGAQILAPVSLGRSSGLPNETPVIRVTVLEEGFAATVHLAWGILGLLGLGLLVGSILMADRLGRHFVRPIQALAATAQQLGAHDLSTRARMEGPSEIREVAAALNRLVDRATALLQRERENVADLSHRLRTPITALRLAVESMPHSGERNRLTADVDTLEAMIDDVVREAHRSQREGLAPCADVAAVLKERTAFWRPLAEDQARPFDVTVAVENAVRVRASAADLEAMVDALMDNVFTYTPEGTAIAVLLKARDSGGVELTVDDTGPGFPDAVDVTGRGFSSRGSTGLGLSIVRRTAEASGGDLQLDTSPLGGARVWLTLGLAH